MSDRLRLGNDADFLNRKFDEFKRRFETEDFRKLAKDHGAIRRCIGELDDIICDYLAFGEPDGEAFNIFIEENICTLSPFPKDAKILISSILKAAALKKEEDLTAMGLDEKEKNIAPEDFIIFFRNLLAK